MAPNIRPTKKDNGLHCPLFVLDTAFMSDIINGYSIRNSLFAEIMRRKANNLPFQAVTTLSAFKRAILLANNNGSVHNIRLIMELAKIYPSNTDYKDGTAVAKELDKFVKLMSEGAL